MAAHKTRRHKQSAKRRELKRTCATYSTRLEEYDGQVRDLTNVGLINPSHQRPQVRERMDSSARGMKREGEKVVARADRRTEAFCEIKLKFNKKACMHILQLCVTTQISVRVRLSVADWSTIHARVGPLGLFCF